MNINDMTSEQKPIDKMTGEEIAAALQARYQGMFQCQNEIALLNQELQKRMKSTETTEVVSNGQ